LRFFKNVAHQAGLAARLDATFAELERLGKGAGDLQELLAELGPAAGDQADDPAAALRDKIYDLRLLYDAYSAYLGQERLDQHHRLLQVLQAIENSRLFDDATVYVDAFWEFTQYECRLIAHLGKVCRHVEISLLMDVRSPLLRVPDQLPNELSLFHRVEMAYRRLWFVLKEQGIAIDGPPVLLDRTPRFRTAALTAIEQHLFERTRPLTARHEPKSMPPRDTSTICWAKACAIARSPSSRAISKVITN
jgi:ATP-dependent helicase/nuclease subunit B